MAYKSMLFLAMLFVIMATTPLAHGNVLSGLNIAQVQIAGRLFCSATGNAVPGTTSPGLAGVNVILSCSGGSTNLSQALTDTSGFFNVVYNTVDSLLFDASTCFVTVQLPVATCTLLPPTGNLRALPTFVNVVQRALGLIAMFTTQVFQIVVV